LLSAVRLHGVVSRYLLIVTTAALGAAILFVLGLLYIQTILLIWSASISLVILQQESSGRLKEMDGQGTTSGTRWISIKKELDDVEGRMSSTLDKSELKLLSERKRMLQAELRRMEWTSREEVMNRIFMASHVRLNTINKGCPASPRMSKKESFARKRLMRIMKEVESVLLVEQERVRPVLLERISGELKGLFRELRASDDASLKSDLFVAWALVNAAGRNERPDLKLLRYASPSLRRRIRPFVNSMPTSWVEEVDSASPWEVSV
jgi:hypothetical protein